jgi:hypothetical protein
LKTLLIELRYSSQPGICEPYSGLVDGINDVVLELADRFSLDVLSISHVMEDAPSRKPNHTSITCTAVCQLNQFSAEQIGETLEPENKLKGRLYCFLERHNKLSVRVSEINYN